MAINQAVRGYIPGCPETYRAVAVPHHPLFAARGTLLRPCHGPVRQQAARRGFRYHAEMRPTGGTGERAQRLPEVGGDPSQPQDAARQAVRDHLALCGDDARARR